MERMSICPAESRSFSDGIVEERRCILPAGHEAVGQGCVWRVVSQEAVPMPPLEWPRAHRLLPMRERYTARLAARMATRK